MMLEGKVIKETIEGRQIFVYLPPNYDISTKNFPVVYVHDGKELEQIIEIVMQEVEKSFVEYKKDGFILVGIYANERIHEYTPWPAKALNPKFQDFKGEGELYLNWIIDKVVPYVNLNYKSLQTPSHNAIMGYSLGGLISMYAAFRKSYFGKSISISGSFWYERVVDFIEEHELINEQMKIYMSYGMQEGKEKKTIQAEAVICAERVKESLQRKLKGENLVYVYTDNGGHHDHLITRYQNALKWLVYNF